MFGIDDALVEGALEVAKESVTEVAKEAVTEVAKEGATESVKEVANEGAKETVKEAAHYGVSELMKEVAKYGVEGTSQEGPFKPSDFMHHLPSELNTGSNELSPLSQTDVTHPGTHELSPGRFEKPEEIGEGGQATHKATPENSTIERVSTFEQQTIDNFKLEDMRPEVNDRLKLGEEHSGGILRYNLQEVTGENPEASNAHHIVGRDTPRAAEILEKFGIDRNDPANGIFLPDSMESPLKGAVHGPGQHIKEYSNEVEQRFLLVNSREEALEALQSLKEDLYAGNLALHYNMESNK